MDRLVHWRRLSSAAAAAAGDASGELDETWGYAHSTKASSDTSLVCDWASVDLAADASALPTCAKDATCNGHQKDSITPFDVAMADGVTSTKGLTNLAMFDFLSPSNDQLPYTYADFSWSHCDAEGLRFGQQADGTSALAFALP
jgi:hypothetical protein